MTLDHILAIYVAPRMRPMDTGLQALLARCRKTSPFISGPATTAERQQRRDGVALMVERELLAFEAKRLRNLSRCREASACEDRLRALTTAILRGAE